MEDSAPQPLTNEASPVSWPSITSPIGRSGRPWKPLSAADAAISLRSARQAVEFSAAHPIIQSLRAEATCPPQTFSREETRWWRKWVLLECSCGSLFPLERFIVRKKIRAGYRSLHCSHQCHNRTQLRTVCVVCGTSLARKSNTKTCGTPACREELFRSKRVFRPCRICGAELQRGQARFCSREHAAEAHSRLMLTGERRRYSTLFLRLRPLIRERDGFRCAVCETEDFGANGRTLLVVHHINEDKSDDRPENLISLCRACHVRHHASKKTPFPQLSGLAAARSGSMTSRLQARITSLQEKYSRTTA
jgi:5-methylcytosine-specific restriction endonuclease McrA